MHEVLLAAVLSVSSAALAPGQEATPAQDTGLTIRSNVQEVVLDMSVRDAKGRPVKNLKPQDVEIYEDGVKQQVRTFRYVPGREAVREQVAQQQPASPANANPLRAPNLVCIVYHNLDTDPARRQYVSEAVQEFLKNPLPPDTWVSAFSLDTHLTPLHPFTKDREELARDAVQAYAGAAVDFASMSSAILSASPNMATLEVAFNGTPGPGVGVEVVQRVTGGEINKRAIAGAEVSTGQGASRVRGEIASQRRAFGGIEGRRQLDQLNDMVNAFKTLPGRKVVLLLSPGLLTTGDPDLFDPILERANQAGITVYAIDTNGLSENSTTLASSQQLQRVADLSSSQRRAGASAGEMMERMRQGDYLNAAVRTSDTQAALRALAEGTGGFLVANTNELKKPFQRVIEDMDAHYEAVYRPTSDKLDGKLRSIQVKLARPDATVQSRTGYFAVPMFEGSPELAPHEVDGLMALNMKSRLRAFEFGAAALQFRPSGSRSRYALAFEVPVGGLKPVSLPSLKRTRIHLSLLAVVKDTSGNIVHKFSKDAPYEVPDESWARIRTTPISFEDAVDLPPGSYTLETAIVDREANRASTSAVAFENPAASGLGLSSVMLVQRVEAVSGKADPADPFQFQADPSQGRRVVPELAPNINANVKPAVYFVVYPDKTNAGKPKVQVEFLVDGKLLAKQVADLPAPDAAGSIPMVVGAAAKPGNCELRITALQGASSKTQSVRYSVAPS